MKFLFVLITVLLLTFSSGAADAPAVKSIPADAAAANEKPVDASLLKKLDKIYWQWHSAMKDCKDTVCHKKLILEYGSAGANKELANSESQGKDMAKLAQLTNTTSSQILFFKDRCSIIKSVQTRPDQALVKYLCQLPDNGPIRNAKINAGAFFTLENNNWKMGK